MGVNSATDGTDPNSPVPIREIVAPRQPILALVAQVRVPQLDANLGSLSQYAQDKSRNVFACHCAKKERWKLNRNGRRGIGRGKHRGGAERIFLIPG